jgi:hypothetical protein
MENKDRRPAVGSVLAKRSHVAEAQQASIASFVSQPRGAVHVGPCIFPCYLQERIVLAMECSPRQCRLAMELPAMNCGGYTLHPTDQPNETA